MMEEYFKFTLEYFQKFKLITMLENVDALHVFNCSCIPQLLDNVETNGHNM